MMTLYSSSQTGSRGNTMYPQKVEVTTLEQFKEITATDHVMSTFEGNKRHGDNFTSCDCLYADVDNTHTEDPSQWMTLKKFKATYKDYSYYVSTSKSHQLEKAGAAPRDKFHIYFPIKEITKAVKLKDLLKALTSFEYFDPAVKDVARCFWGSPTAEVFTNKGKDITAYLKTVEISDRVKESARLDEMGEGSGRNDELIRIAGAMQGRGETEGDIQKELFRVNAEFGAPLPDSEVFGVVDSVLRYAPDFRVQSDIVLESLMSMKELKERDIEEPKTFIKNMLTVGSTILSGRAKLGKSWLVLQMAEAIATGKPFLGHETTKAKVLYIDLESHPFMFRSRIEKQGWKDSTDVVFYIDEHGAFPSDNAITHLERMLDLCKAEVVIIDMLRRFQNRPKTNGGNAQDEDYAWVTPFLKVANERGIAVLVTHHDNKGSQGHRGDNVAGSMGMQGGFTTVMHLDAQSFNVTSRNTVGADVSCAYSPDSGRWEMISDEEATEMRKESAGKRNKAGDLKKQRVADIVQFLKDNKKEFSMDFILKSLDIELTKTPKYSLFEDVVKVDGIGVVRGKPLKYFYSE